MKLSIPGSKLMGRLHELARFPRDSRGVAAVEFALILPILIAFYLGLNEVQPGFSIKQKLGLTTRAVADLSTRNPKLSAADLKNIFSAASAIMRPYTSISTQIVVSSISVTANAGSTSSVGKVVWSCPWGTAKSTDTSVAPLQAKKIGDPYKVPEDFKATKSFIVVETRYPYPPKFGYAFMNTIELNDSIEWPVRDADSVTFTETCPT